LKKIHITTAHNFFIIRFFFLLDRTCTVRKSKYPYARVQLLFTSFYPVNHCVKCFCTSPTTVNCIKINQQTYAISIVCNDCTHLPTAKCPYCLHPVYGQSRRVETGKLIKVPGLDCVSCRCPENGEVYCEYDEGYSCSGIPDCQNMFETFKSVNSSYVCRNCSFADDGDNSKAMRRPGEEWFSIIEDYEVVCECHNTGVVSCSVHAEIDGGFRMEVDCENCTRLKAEMIFSNQGKFIYFYRAAILP